MADVKTGAPECRCKKAACPKDQSVLSVPIVPWPSRMSGELDKGLAATVRTHGARVREQDARVDPALVGWTTFGVHVSLHLRMPHLHTYTASFAEQRNITISLGHHLCGRLS